MKSNVDLTLNQMFSSSNRKVSIGDMFEIEKLIKHPTSRMNWIFRDDDDYGEGQLVITGNGKTRKNILRYKAYETVDTCPCCGKKVKEPWYRENGLCRDCDNYYSGLDKKLSWR